MIAGRKTLDELHQKAQALLNMKSSSSSDDISSEQPNYFVRKPIKNVKHEIKAVTTQRTDDLIKLENYGKKGIQAKVQQIELKKSKPVSNSKNKGKGLVIPRR